MLVLWNASVSVNRIIALDSHTRNPSALLNFSLFTDNGLMDGYDYRAVTVRVWFVVNWRVRSDLT